MTAIKCIPPLVVNGNPRQYKNMQAMSMLSFGCLRNKFGKASLKLPNILHKCPNKLSSPSVNTIMKNRKHQTAEAGRCVIPRIYAKNIKPGPLSSNLSIGRFITSDACPKNINTMNPPNMLTNEFVIPRISPSRIKLLLKLL